MPAYAHAIEIGVDGIEAAIAQTCATSGMADRLVLSSFNHFSLMAIHEAVPGLEIAPLYTDGLVDPWVYVQHLGLNSVHPFFVNLFAPGVPEGYREAGIKVRPWTVDDPQTLSMMLQLGVDAIITDNPTEALALRASMGAHA